MIAIRSGRHSKPIPRRDAVILQAPRGAPLLKRLKCRAQALVKLFFRNLGQLRLRIVDVINVHTTDTHVSERLLQLILQIGWSHAVTAADDILPTRYAGFDKRLFNIAANVSRRRAVKRQITTLRADDQFIAREPFGGSQVTQSRADGAFASLKPVVCRRIDYIGA